ncbi:MAG: gliding motility-associated C-terminal domain-containing protein, partial [Chloroflexi bacterium]
VNPVKTTTIDTAICQGEAFLAGGQWQTNSGTYYDTLATYLGCDSIIITNLTVNPVPNTLINIEICDGDSIFAGGQWQYFAGSYYDTLQTFRGCDSIIETRLTVHPSYLDTIDASICDGDQYWAGGQWQSSPGVYTDMYLSVKGCDSIVVTRLTVHPVFLVTLDTTICYGQTYLSPGGNPYTQSGQYLDTLQSVMGCDSVILTRLTVSQPVVDLGNDTFICEGNTILLDAGNHSGYQWQDNSTGQVYTVTEEGVYSVTVTDTAGCTATDSIILIHRCPYRLFIPNAFSPNDDGINDVFKIYGKDLLKARLSIYNRWGEKCFETDDISEGWDGRINGKIAEPGVYVWQLYFEGYD